MNCPNCHKENKDTGINCTECGTTLVHPAIESPPSPLKEYKMNVLLLVLLVLITFGVYAAVWYIKRLKAFNSLESKIKLQLPIFVVVAVFYAFDYMMLLLYPGGELSGNLRLRIIEMGFSFILLLQSFRVRAMLIDHYNVNLKKNIYFSWLYTMLFTQFYLQHKINQLE